MRIAICDDCREDALYLQSLLGGMHMTVLYESARELLADVRDARISYDLYLLDIYLDSMDGIRLAKQIRLVDEYGAVCFVSSSDAFYREAYDLYAVQYLLKPVEPETLRQLLERVSRHVAKNKELSLHFRWRGQLGAIPYNRILFVSSRAHTLSIYCRDGYIQSCTGRLDEIAERVAGDTFCRCHQSYLVNMYYVDNLDGNDMTLAGYHIPISRRYAAEVKKRYREILFEEMD